MVVVDLAKLFVRDSEGLFYQRLLLSLNLILLVLNQGVVVGRKLVGVKCNPIEILRLSAFLVKVSFS